MAQTRALMISEKYVKDNSPIDNNVDMHLIRPTIWYCQKEYIEKSLGTVFYDAIIAELIANSGSLVTATYITLVDSYLADALMYWTMYESQVSLLFKYRNKSVGKNSDPNYQPIDLKEHIYLRDYYQTKAQYFSKRMEDYICYNSSDYPLWTDCSEGGVDARETKYTSSLYLEGEDSIERIKFVRKYGLEL